MAVGLSTPNLANAWLNTIRGGAAGTTFTAPTAVFVKLHIGDPTSAGAGAPSSVTTRPAITFGAAASGVITSSGTAPSWPAWAGSNGEIVTHISLWDNATAGNFLLSIPLTSSKTMGTGDTLNLTTAGTTVSLTPLAA